MNGINYKVIPHSEQRYDTCGDYWLDENGIYQIRVSKMSDWRYEFLVFFHECLELAWVIFNKISLADIDAFDIEYENNRAPDDIKSEPGDDPKAPYHAGHQYASMCEHIAATVLGVKWDAYDSEVMHL